MTRAPYDLSEQPFTLDHIPDHASLEAFLTPYKMLYI